MKFLKRTAQKRTIKTLKNGKNISMLKYEAKSTDTIADLETFATSKSQNMAKDKNLKDLKLQLLIECENGYISSVMTWAGGYIMVDLSMYDNPSYGAIKSFSIYLMQA